MALEETFGPATNSDSAPKIGGGSIGGAIVGGAISKVLSDEKFERDKRLREEEVARLQQRENTAYSRSIADMLRAGYDPRSGQTPPSASPSASVAPVESPNTAEVVSAGMSAGQQIGTAEQSFFATQRQLDQQQEQNEWTITGNMFSHLRQSIDDDLSLAQNDSQYYHGRYIELKKFVSQEMEIGGEASKRTFDEYETAYEKKKNELLSQRHNVSVQVSAGNDSGAKHSTEKGSSSSSKNSDSDNINAYTSEVVGQTIGFSESSSLTDKLQDVLTKSFKFGGSAGYGYQRLTEDEKSELRKWSHKWLDEQMSKSSAKYKGLSEKDKEAIQRVIADTYDNYMEARNYITSIRDKKSELYRVTEEQYNSHEANRYRSPRGKESYFNKDVEAY